VAYFLEPPCRTIRLSKSSTAQCCSKDLAGVKTWLRRRVKQVKTILYYIQSLTYRTMKKLQLCSAIFQWRTRSKSGLENFSRGGGIYTKYAKKTVWIGILTVFRQYFITAGTRVILYLAHRLMCLSVLYNIVFIVVVTVVFLSFALILYFRFFCGIIYCVCAALLSKLHILLHRLFLVHTRYMYSGFFFVFNHWQQ